MSTGKDHEESSSSPTVEEPKAGDAKAAEHADHEHGHDHDHDHGHEHGHDHEHGDDEGEEPKRKLSLDVQIADSGPCKKHVKVAISRDDVEHQFDESLGELRKEAAVPGFRPGHAPRKLVEKRFRKEVAGQVKSALLMACMEQLDEDYKLNAITQPDLDVGAIELPDEGPMRFEMDVEVQPEFEVPNYKGLTIEKPVHSISESDVDAQLTLFLERHAQMVPKLEGTAEVGDFVTADLRFHRDGILLNQVKEVQFRLQPELRFQDGRVPKLSEALVGCKPGDSREAEAEIGSSSPDPALRGQKIRVSFHVLDLKVLRLPEVNTGFLHSIGFDDVQELRVALREILERRLQFQQRQAIRRSILGRLVNETPFDLPADLVNRQERVTLSRQVMAMREEGATENQIRAREAEIRANAHEQTLQSLKEFFILSKIAEAEGVKVEAEDIEDEIEAVAVRSDESPRRIRARIEKEGLGEALASQILERKTIDQILTYVEYKDVPLVEDRLVETLDQTAGAAQPEEEAAPAAAEAGAPEPAPEETPGAAEPTA